MPWAIGRLGVLALSMHLEPLDPRPGARLQLRRLGGQRDEGAAGLFAGDDLGCARRVVAGLEPVAGMDAFAHGGLPAVR